MHPRHLPSIFKKRRTSRFKSLVGIALLISYQFANAANDSIETSNIDRFYVVKPRTLMPVEDEVSVSYSTNHQEIRFTIKVLKPETYALKAQENDNIFENEHIRLYISPDADARNVYVFGVNHQNAYFDGIYNEQSGLNTDWNGQWHYEVNQHPNYWVVEGSIPWGNFSFRNTDDSQKIKIGIAKHGNNQQRILFNTPSYIGYTGFLDSLNEIRIDTKNQSSLDIFPYYSLNHSFLEDGKVHNVGGELFWQPTQNQSVDLTFNPDFGQVESNDLVVNFSALEVFSSEQRPFFARNQSLYDITGPENLLLVHTPRIGGNSAYEEIGSRDINAAARYNVSFGAASYSLLFARENDTQILQGRDFLAARGKFITDSGTWGLSANFVDTPSIDRRSTVFGLDYFVALNESFEVVVGFINTNIQGPENESDMGAWIQSSFEFDDTHLHDLSLFVYGEHFDVNDIGFVQRVDRKQFEYEYTYLIPNPTIDYIAHLLLKSELEIKTNFANENLPKQFGVGIELSTIDDSNIEIAIEFISAGKDDLLTREFNSTNLDKGWLMETLYESPEYEYGQMTFELEFGTENWSQRFINASASLETELFSGIFAKLELSQYQSNSWLNWEGENLVDEYKFLETGIDLKLNYRFLEWHELRLRLELVAGKARAKSGNVIQLNGNRFASEIPDDFSFAEAAFQLRYKYSLSKLSAIFVSYTFGGEFEEDAISESRRGLYRKAIDEKNIHGLFLKARLQF